MCLPRMSLTVYCLQDARAVPASVTVLLVWARISWVGRIDCLDGVSVVSAFGNYIRCLGTVSFNLRNEISQGELLYSRQDWVSKRLCWKGLVRWKAVKPLCRHIKSRTRNEEITKQNVWFPFALAKVRFFSQKSSLKKKNVKNLTYKKRMQRNQWQYLRKKIEEK